MPAVLHVFLRMPLAPPIIASTKQPLLHACCFARVFAYAIGSPNYCQHKTATFACLLFCTCFCVCHWLPQLLPAQNSHFCMPAVLHVFLRMPLAPPIIASTKQPLLHACCFA